MTDIRAACFFAKQTKKTELDQELNVTFRSKHMYIPKRPPKPGCVDNLKSVAKRGTNLPPAGQRNDESARTAARSRTLLGKAGERPGTAVEVTKHVHGCFVVKEIFHPDVCFPLPAFHPGSQPTRLWSPVSIRLCSWAYREDSYV